jgi:isoleucyl-tRNA synthetase
MDYKATIFLPKTDFPMRADLPNREPQILERWDRAGLFDRLREVSRGSASSCTTVRPTPTGRSTSATP